MAAPSASVPAESRVTFRPLREDDPPRLLQWLRDPDVLAWYGDGDLSLALVEARYATRIAGTDTTRAFIIEIDGEPAGYIQCYRLVDEPDYLGQLELPLPLHRNAVGTDLFIGDPERRNHGWGVPVLTAFHRRIVFGEMGADPAIIAPEPGNLRAIKVYERVGFRWFRTVPVEDPTHPENSGDEYVMILSRSMFEQSARTHNEPEEKERDDRPDVSST